MKALDSVAILPRPLTTLALDLHNPELSPHANWKLTLPTRNKIIQGLVDKLESIAIPSDSLVAHRYPSYVCIKDRYYSFRLQQSGMGGLRYTRMCTEEVEDLESTLPGGKNASLWL